MLLRSLTPRSHRTAYFKARSCDEGEGSVPTNLAPTKALIACDARDLAGANKIGSISAALVLDVSFRIVSKTDVASLMSPRNVANSANRRCCTAVDGAGDEGLEGTGVGGPGVPKNLRVVENRREGRRRVEIYLIQIECHA